MIKKCKRCGVDIDLTGLGTLAEFINNCEPCGEIMNEELAEKSRSEREEEARERRTAFAKRQWEKVVPPLYRQTDVKHQGYPRPLDAVAKQWMSGEMDNEPSRSWFGVVGVSGKGKTRVMSQVLRNRIWNGKRCQWVNATQFQWCAQNQHDRNDGEAAKKHLANYRKCDFLAFDDLGKQKWTDTVESLFYDLIEHRYSQLLPMMWTSNSTLEELKMMLTEDRRDAITGRLAETSNIVEL